MTPTELRARAPRDAEYYHPKIGFMKDVFGKNIKARAYIDGEWKRINLYSCLPTNEFKKIVRLP